MDMVMVLPLKIHTLITRRDVYPIAVNLISLATFFDRLVADKAIFPIIDNIRVVVNSLSIVINDFSTKDSFPAQQEIRGLHIINVSFKILNIRNRGFSMMNISFKLQGFLAIINIPLNIIDIFLAPLNFVSMIFLFIIIFSVIVSVFDGCSLQTSIR